MEPIDSVIDGASIIYKDVYIRNSEIREKAILSDRSVIISSEIDYKAVIGRNTSVIYSHFGRGSFIGSDSVVKFTEIGKYCCLSWHLSIGGSNHNYKAACMYTDSTWKWVFGVGNGLEPVPREDYAVIGNDVWIGAGANILRGVKIGDGAVIGANSLVLHDVPPYAIAVGCPAKIIKYRFEKDVIDRLLKIKWWDWDPEQIEKAADLLRGDLNEEKLRGLEERYREFIDQS